MRRHLFWAMVLACVGGTAEAAETTVPRYLEFRDGSVLRLPVVDEDWKVTLLRPEGGMETKTLRLSSLQALKFTPERVFQKKQAVLAAVQKMGADEFSQREQGQEELIKMGPDIRPDLEVALQLFSDVEVQHRIRQILGKWSADPVNPAPALAPFDIITGQESLWGDAGDVGIAVVVDGVTRRLSRRYVHAMTVRAPDIYGLDSHKVGPGGFRRIEAKDFPPGCLEEGFETAPDGRKLSAGENVEKVFVSKGFVLSTSVKTSYVAVNNFRVEGKTGGLSVATHEPLYQGEVTIRFVQPGRENVPAGVTYFGCWMAVVMANGTSLVAYDLQGREVGRIHTEHGPHEFMAIQSAVPMHEIHVVPNLQIDPDYTLDDFIYTAPQPADVRHPDKYTVQLTDGERVLCREVLFTKQEVRLQGLPAELPDRTCATEELMRVTTPTRGRPEHSSSPGVFAELRDGSVLFGTAGTGKGSGPVFARRSQTLKEADHLVGIWKADVPRMAWPTQLAPPVLWDSDKKAWQKVADVNLTDEGVGYTAEAGKRQTRPYGEVAALLLAPPAQPQTGSWHVRTAQGEEIVLEGGESAALSGKLSDVLNAVWQGKALNIPADELVAVIRVPKGP